MAQRREFKLDRPLTNGEGILFRWLAEQLFNYCAAQVIHLDGPQVFFRNGGIKEKKAKFETALEKLRSFFQQEIFADLTPQFEGNTDDSIVEILAGSHDQIIKDFGDIVNNIGKAASISRYPISTWLGSLGLTMFGPGHVIPLETKPRSLLDYEYFVGDLLRPSSGVKRSLKLEKRILKDGPAAIPTLAFSDDNTRTIDKKSEPFLAYIHNQFLQEIPAKRSNCAQFGVDLAKSALTAVAWGSFYYGLSSSLTLAAHCAGGVGLILLLAYLAKLAKNTCYPPVRMFSGSQGSGMVDDAVPSNSQDPGMVDEEEHNPYDTSWLTSTTPS